MGIGKRTLPNASKDAPLQDLFGTQTQGSQDATVSTLDLQGGKELRYKVYLKVPSCTGRRQERDSGTRVISTGYGCIVRADGKENKERASRWRNVLMNLLMLHINMCWPSPWALSFSKTTSLSPITKPQFKSVAQLAPWHGSLRCTPWTRPRPCHCAPCPCLDVHSTCPDLQSTSFRVAPAQGSTQNILAQDFFPAASW